MTLTRLSVYSVSSLFILGTMLLYLYTVQIQNGRNDVYTMSDQLAHMRFARKAYESGFTYTGSRNYMPLFAFVQAALNSPELDDEAFFQRGKEINIWISVAALASLAFVFFAKFSRLYSFYAIMSIGFLAFAFKAPFFQPEILSYTLFGFAFILSVETLLVPKWYKSVGIGALFALAHFVKANALPALVILSACHIILMLTKAINSKLNFRIASLIILRALIPLIVFVVLLFPYFHESNTDYGDFFFNVNTRIYIWFDSWEEAKAATSEVGGYGGFLKLPDDEVPGVMKYLREHSFEQIINRLHDGIQEIIGYACYVENSKFIFGYCSQVAQGLIVLSTMLPLMIGSLRREDLHHMHIISFLVIVFTIYTLGAFWFKPISGQGPRTILVLLIPFYWTLGLALHSRVIQNLKIRLFSYQIKLVDLLFVSIGSTLFLEIYQVVTWRASYMYGGK